MRVGNSCRPLADGGLDSLDGAADADPDAEQPGVCGDGKTKGREACDDGALVDGDGCSRSCKVEAGWSCIVPLQFSRCALLPEAPVVVGAASAAPDLVHWQWNVPERTRSFELQLDGQPYDTQDAAAPREVRLTLADGAHTFEVRACNDTGGCSAWAASTTTVERFGKAYSSALDGTRRVLAQTLLGHGAAVACNNCFLGANAAPLVLADALSSLSTALTRGADVLDLDVIRVGDTLYLARTDTADETSLLSLSAVLSDSRLLNSDALLALEIAEDDSEPKAFAKSLFALLGGSSRIARNGRPLLLRAQANRLKYLEAIASEGRSHPFLSPYLRYLADDLPAATELRFLSFLHGLLLDFRTPNLFGRLGEAKKRGLGTGVLNVPGPGHGEIVLGALREEVDLFFTDYRAEQAQQILRAPADGAYVNARAQLAIDMPLAVHRFENGMVSVLNRSLGAAPNLSFG